MERRLTRQRETILNILKDRYDHPTADQLFLEIRRVIPRISLGTVYRNLDVLRQAGWVRVVVMPGEPRRYDCNIVPHHHFLCTDCGKIYDFSSSSGSGTDSVLLPGFTISKQSVEWEGVCAECNRKKPETAEATKT